MAAEFTTYEPAEDLDSDMAITTFMAEAFATEDVGCIGHDRRSCAWNAG